MKLRRADALVSSLQKTLTSVMKMLNIDHCMKGKKGAEKGTNDYLQRVTDLVRLVTRFYL